MSGYAAAKWSTESRVQLTEASTLRVDASRADSEAATLRNFDSSTFEAWFAAYIARNDAAMRVAEHRFRPEFRVAFDAWRATNPETNPNAPRGPTFMPEYKQPGIAEARALDERGAAGAWAASAGVDDRLVHEALDRIGRIRAEEVTLLVNALVCREWHRRDRRADVGPGAAAGIGPTSAQEDGLAEGSGRDRGAEGWLACSRSDRDRCFS